MGYPPKSVTDPKPPNVKKSVLHTPNPSRRSVTPYVREETSSTKSDIRVGACKVRVQRNRDFDEPYRIRMPSFLLNKFVEVPRIMERKRHRRLKGTEGLPVQGKQ